MIHDGERTAAVLNRRLATCGVAPEFPTFNVAVKVSENRFVRRQPSLSVAAGLPTTIHPPCVCCVPVLSVPVTV